jgi:hypothetical protein
VSASVGRRLSFVAFALPLGFYLLRAAQLYPFFLFSAAQEEQGMFAQTREKSHAPKSHQASLYPRWDMRLPSSANCTLKAREIRKEKQ